MLPFPCSPSSSWAIYRARLKAVFDGANPWVCISFWLFGLINNVLYVIILTAAQDLVGQSVPKGVVLLADVVPSFITKLLAPYFIHRIPYNMRIMIFATLSFIGMLLVACSPTAAESSPIGIKMFGIVLASISSGGGELSFLGLTHYYGHFALAFWASGTGGAGLIGAWAYVIATTWAGLSVRLSLLTFSFLPAIMLASFFWLLPKGPLAYVRTNHHGYESLENEEPSEPLNTDDDHYENILHGHQSEDLLSPLASPPTGRSSGSVTTWSGFKANLSRSRALFFPYMLPLLLVYVAEYTINQGVAPTLLFPLDSSPFEDYLSFYRTYNAIYQAGVFISRSSTPFFRIHQLYPPSILQIANLILLTLHAIFDFIPTVWIVFLVIFWEGLLGGLVYVSTFAEITDNVPKPDREFSLGATSVSDSGGICIAGFLSMMFEIWLCNYQVSHGRDYCKRVSVHKAA